MKRNKNFCIFVCIYVVLFLILAQNVAAVNPFSPKKCHLEDSYCLTKQAQATLKAFIKGIPELGIEPFDTVHIGYTEVRENKLHYQMWNNTVNGFNNTIIDEVSINMAYKLLRISFHSNLIIDFDYVAEGEVYGFPITGDGKSEIKLNNLQMEILINFDIEKNEHGKDVINLKKFAYGADALDGAHHYFGNLFNGNKLKSDVAHFFMNKTWRTLVSNYGRFFVIKIIEKIFEALKVYMHEWPLEELAIYTDKQKI